MWKLLAKKKAKALPEAPRLDGSAFYVEEHLPVDPEPMDSESADGWADEPDIVLFPVLYSTPTVYNPECDCMVLDVEGTVRPDKPADDGYNPNIPPHLRDIEQDTPPSDGGGGGSYYEPSETPEQRKQRECQECKEIMQRKYDTRMNEIRYVTARDLAVVCHLEGAAAFTAVNVIGSWAHFFPGIGTATVELLAVVAGLAVDINCLLSRAFSTVKEMADAKAGLYTDMQTCSSKCN
ncbi:hypothetical protein F5984_05145 [Rudanella paleaurantiibacter]|uniref:Uncharacterized protein n=1 Tax=Rudanella paleaurantiibacter TaxID=2614655 RepID=A0A7J5U1D5_9BACT|nr:hypothetical protein [Rudanella paleaurantiibacter]KAB7731619.1 hypothetical protein F5984_05145 [Rudanella paleaurantiibacter]